MDLAVEVGSNRDREIGWKKGEFPTQKGVMEKFELSDEHLVLKLIIARFNLVDFLDVTVPKLDTSSVLKYRLFCFF